VVGYLPPILQRLARIRMFFPEFPQRSFANGMQPGRPPASYALKLRISCQVLVSCHGLQMKTLAAVLPCGRSPQERSC
jgi:hypothetical protein